MLARSAADVRQSFLTSRWLLTVLTLLLLLCTRLSSAHSTTVEHDFHIVHNVDNRSPEIDPFWYVGRGVRPIGRFGKRHSAEVDLSSRDMQPVLRTLEMLLNSLKHKNQLHKVPLNADEQDWLP
ncbi:hypothetical protein WMY93_030739 [Mugilogobius chulae]|uniref:Prolactin releasing hormone 2 n=1 Tax=Mugilogobius chulae TaxID=88201 RepID=A0AAW0MRW5_9GOBI